MTTIAASLAAVIADSSPQVPAFDADPQQGLRERARTRPLPADADFAIIPFVPERAAGQPTPVHSADVGHLGQSTQVRGRISAVPEHARSHVGLGAGPTGRPR